METWESGQSVDPAVVENIATQIFQVMPLLKKRLLHLDTIQAEHAIPLSHVQVLAVLEKHGSMTVTEISRLFGIAKPNITPLVDRLIEAGLVERTRDKADRRVVNVVILEAGREKLADIQRSIYQHLLTWTNSISAEEFQELSDSLSSITRILDGV